MSLAERRTTELRRLVAHLRKPGEIPPDGFRARGRCHALMARPLLIGLSRSCCLGITGGRRSGKLVYWRTHPMRRLITLSVVVLLAAPARRRTPRTAASRRSRSSSASRSRRTICGTKRCIAGRRRRSSIRPTPPRGTTSRSRTSTRASSSEAKKAYEKALELDPKNLMIRQNYDLFKEINDRTKRRSGK